MFERTNITNLHRVFVVMMSMALLLTTSFAQAQDTGLPWADELIKRELHNHQLMTKCVDRVVLVPDIDTYFDELSRWSSRGIWPVLIEDDRYAPMFLRRFKPEQVMRRDAVKTPRLTPDEMRLRMEDIVIRTWAGDPEEMDIAEAFEARQHVPLGVVVTNVNDAGLAAAVPLAACRGQLLIWNSDVVMYPNSVLPHDQVVQFQRSITSAIDEHGYTWDALGDDIETITIARTAGARCYPPRQKSGETRAMTDVLGRHDDGKRFAFASQIFGSEVRCAYVAMCSLFLDRQSFSLTNTYPSEGGWARYNMEDSARLLNETSLVGVAPIRRSGEQATLDSWRRNLRGGWTNDIAFVNTKGNASWFHSFDEKQTLWSDIPVMNTPMAVHFIHSWSSLAPDAPGTIAHSWLEHGAFAFVGSVHEPMLTAFVTPKDLTVRMLAGLPFLVSARHIAGPAADRPWKVMTYGDALMPLFQLYAKPLREEILLSPREDAVDLKDVVRDGLRVLEQQPDHEIARDVIRNLILLDRDEMALQVWELAKQKECADLAAHDMIGVMFRAQNFDGMLDVLDYTVPLDDVRRDMVWHLLEGRARGRDGQRVVMALEAALRSPREEDDVRRLVPLARSTFGVDHARNLVQRAMRNTKTDASRKALSELLSSLK